MGELLSAKDLEGAKPLLSDADLEGARAERPSKYPRSARLNKQGKPEDIQDENERLDLATGPVKSARLPGTALSIPLRPDMGQLEYEHLNDQAVDAAKRVEGALGSGVIGAGAGAGAAGLARRAAPAAGSAVEKAAEMASKAISNTHANGIGGIILGGMHGHGVLGGLVGGVIGAASAPVAQAALRVAPAAARAVGNAAVAAAPAVGAAATTAATSMPQSPMFNMVDRLRTSGSQRGQELYAKIQALKSPDLAGAGTGEVTQGPAGAMP